MSEIEDWQITSASMSLPCDKPGCAGKGTFDGNCPGSDDESHHCVDCGQLWWDDKGRRCAVCNDYWCPDWQREFTFPRDIDDDTDSDTDSDTDLGPNDLLCPSCSKLSRENLVEKLAEMGKTSHIDLGVHCSRL